MLKFTFVYFQRRCSTRSQLQRLFGDDIIPNGQWLEDMHAIDEPACQIRQWEMCMDARVHRPFSHEEYLTAYDYFHAIGYRDGYLQVPRDEVMSSPALCMLAIKLYIFQAKAGHDSDLDNIRDRNMF